MGSHKLSYSIIVVIVMPNTISQQPVCRNIDYTLECFVIVYFIASCTIIKSSIAGDIPNSSVTVYIIVSRVKPLKITSQHNVIQTNRNIEKGKQPPCFWVSSIPFCYVALLEGEGRAF